MVILMILRWMQMPTQDLCQMNPVSPLVCMRKGLTSKGEIVNYFFRDVTSYRLSIVQWMTPHLDLVKDTNIRAYMHTYIHTNDTKLEGMERGGQISGELGKSVGIIKIHCKFLRNEHKYCIKNNWGVFEEGQCTSYCSTA